jgi:hypothetical protein
MSRPPGRARLMTSRYAGRLIIVIHVSNCTEVSS